MLLYMNLLDYKLLGIVMILIGVVYLMNRSIKYLKNKVIELETKMIEDKGDSLRAIKNVENDFTTNSNKNGNSEFKKKIKELEEKCKNLEMKSLSDNKWKQYINDFISKSTLNRKENNIKSVNKMVGEDISMKNDNFIETYDISDSESENDNMSDNIAIYSNDNEENHFSNSDLEEISMANNSNNNQQSDNTDSMIPNEIDNKIIEEVTNKNEDNNIKLNVNLIDESVSNEKKSDEPIGNVSDLLKLKLNRLQCMAEEDGIDVNNLNGKKKTKKELADEILKKKNITKEQSSRI